MDSKIERGGASDSRLSGKTFVFFAAGFAAIGGFLFGYDTGVISGAELFLVREFSLSTMELSIIVGGVLAGAAAGALLGGRLADIFGRRRLLLSTAVIFATGAILCAAAQSPQVLILGRIIVGVGIGLSSGTVPVYISEVAPAESRGWQVSLFQLAITIGILVAYLVDYAFSAMQGWRWMFGLAVLPAVLFGAGTLYLPESPRWLVRQGRDETARSILARIRGTAKIDEELREIERSLSLAHERGKFSDLLEKSLRPALIIGIGLAIFQQVTGINTVIYFAPMIIQSAGIPSASGAILATAGIGAVNVLMTLVSMWLIDRMGRKPLLLTGIAGMTISLGVLAGVFHLNSRTGIVPKLAVASLMLYVASFAISLGPIFWLLISEIYPLKVRNSVEGLCASFNWASNLVVALTFLPLMNALGAPSTFSLYGALALCALVFSYYMVPETKGRTLEEIEDLWRKRK